LLYGSGGTAGTLAKVRQKVERAIAFSDRMFPGRERRFEWWSPRAGPSLTAGFEAIERELGGETSVEFIVNAEYAKRVAVLVEKARKGTKATPEPFFRALQILAHLTGAPLHWVDPDVA
jgi:hypothetical protein